MPIYARFYRGLTGLTLRFPWVTVAIAMIIFGGSYRLFDKYVTRGVVWSNFWQNRSYVQVSLSLPRGEELARTDEMARFFEERLKGMPGVDRFETNVRPENATIRVTFPDSIEMTAEPLIIQERLTSYAVQLGGSRISVVGQGPAFSAGGFGGGSPNYRITVFGYNYEAVRDIAEDLGRRLVNFSRIEEVNTNAGRQGFTRDRATELVVEPDRARLAAHGLSSRDLVSQVNAAIAGTQGRRGASMRIGGEEFAFALKLSGHESMDMFALANVPMLGPGGGSVRLGEVATVREREVLNQIIRQNQQYERAVAYEFRGPSRLGDVIQAAVIESTHLPPGYRIEGRSPFQLSREDRRQIYTVMALALVLVFMLTAALFESIRQPLCVLLTVPMALVGVFLIFFYASASFTREAYIGVIMMAGIVVNNAILLIDHINRLRRDPAFSLREAILQGTLDRTRPILMTSATTVFGLLPLVLFTPAADARIWNALGYALIGGLTSSTVFVLTVTPALYLLFERGAERRRLASLGMVDPEPSRPLRFRGLKKRLGMLLILVSFAGCAGRDGSAVRTEQTDSAGISISVAPAADLALAWSLQPLITIGGKEEGPEAFDYVGVNTVGVDTLGHLYVLDIRARRVVVFDSAGGVLRVMGDRGRGPGEIEFPTALGVRPEGTVEVVDELKRVLVRFAPDGSTLPEMPFEGTSPPAEDDRVFLPIADGHVVIASRVGANADERENSILRVAAGDTMVLAGVLMATPSMALYPSCRVSMGLPPLFSSELVWDGAGRYLVTNSVAEYVVQIFEGGRLVRSLRRPIEPSAVTRDLAIQQLGDGLRMNLPQGLCTIPPGELVDGRGFSPVLPVVGAVRIAPDGEVWVRRRVFGSDQTGAIDVFASGGDYLGTLPAGTPMPLALLSGNRALLREVDEWDVQRLVVAAIVR